MKREPFKRLDVNEMKAKKKEVEISEKLAFEADKFARYIDEKTDEAIVSVLQDMGYNIKYPAPLEELVKINNKLEADGFGIHIETEQKELTYVVSVSVMQKVKTLEFSLGGDTDEN